MGKQIAKTAISPTRQEDYPEWYQQVVKAADLAEQSPVRGCMVIKPWGYGIWENLQRVLDRKIKETGHVNAYFPLFIPLSFFEREAEHVEGFAKECAVVTHHRLEPDGKGGLKPAGPLEEPLVVRPTSETIIGETYAKWGSVVPRLAHPDQPMGKRCPLGNASACFSPNGRVPLARGAHRPRDCGRSDGRDASDARRLRGLFRERDGGPRHQGEKTPAERFPGADSTYCIEAVMQDRKALQAGTSHFLGQNFAKGVEYSIPHR